MPRAEDVRIDLHVHVHHHHEWNADIAHVVALLERITRQEETIIMGDLTELEDELANNTSVTESISIFVQDLIAKLDAANGDQATIDDIVNTLRTNDQRVAQLIVANTPAGDGGPEPAPDDSAQPAPVEEP